MIWKNNNIPENIVAEKADAWKTSKILTRLLLNKNLVEKKDVERFINPCLEQLRNPFDFERMEEAVEKIIKLREKKQRIYIYGDYDVDGITAASFLVLVMREIGIDTRYYIPSRMEENYGLDKKTIDFINERDGKMVITVDTGANSIEDIRYAQSLGIEVIVTDHHKSTKEKFDEEYILINPKLSENYKFKYLSGAGVALKLAQGIYRKLKISEERLYKYLDIVMIGTVADVVPMIDENRVIISKGLQVLKETKVKGLVYLIRYLKFQNKNINTTDVSYFVLAFLPNGRENTYFSEASRSAIFCSLRGILSLSRKDQSLSLIHIFRDKTDRVREPGTQPMAHPLGCAGKGGRLRLLHGGGFHRETRSGHYKVRHKAEILS